ncbi:hypothetical protein PCC7424_0854 [Gloeothece citriformis PCC 7424]|uniref:Uncharacterized protein n=1 Tax=Gloeothece citriformis (strain PCC 7424) TaxID=65393 RepID=B7KHA1_GLOC7|nr:hypothetical protein PCC7424_0854 [Gloeothece citriformis PCC 7424]
MQRLYEVHEKDKETLAIRFGITCNYRCPGQNPPKLKHYYFTLLKNLDLDVLKEPRCDDRLLLQSRHR